MSSPLSIRRLAAAALVAAACLTLLGGCTGTAGGRPIPDRLTASTGRASHPPVVFISFDEFSTTSLVGRDGRIDAVRYPSFATLARDGTWLPYATASADETGRAMEALLTGSTPPRGRPPTYAANPRNLFTLLGRRYRVAAAEEVTSMCPRRLCPNVRRQTKHSVLHELATGRPERFRRWIRSLRATRKPTLFFKHVLLPHAPFRYLPSGRHYVAGHDPIAGYAHAFFTRWVSTQKYQRHLLQLGFADRLLGETLRRLRDMGLYDRALIVVTADNGESFGRLGNGHEISPRNLGDIALTPLLIKAPFQRHGAVVRRHVRTVDILPTVAHLVRLRIPWRTEGHSAFGRAARRIPAATTILQRSGRRFSLGLPGLRRWAQAAQRRKLQLFGAGLYGIGPYRRLVGTSVSRWQLSPAGRARAAVNDPRSFQTVRLSSGFLPSYITGRVRASGAPPPRAIAVAVNGRIAATAPPFRVHRRGSLFFSALVPESSFHEGRNQVRVFSVAAGSGGVRLQALG